jgi:hypothetical protein
MGKATGGRREFLRRALVTAAGAPLALSHAGAALGQGRGTGQITLDALLLTYVAAPLGSPGSARWSPRPRYESALSVGGVDGLDLVARVPSNAERVFLGEAFAQTSARGGLVLRRRDRHARIEIGTVAPGVPDHTVFHGFTRPRLRVKELGGGSELRAGYALVGADATFIFSRDSLLHDETIIAQLDPRTIESYLAAYQYDAESLAAPRYAPRGTFGGGGINLIERGTSTGPEVVATTSATVVAVEGLDGSPLGEALAVGREVAVEHSSRQTPTNNAILTVEADLGGEPATVYWDRAFKTFVFAG